MSSKCYFNSVILPEVPQGKISSYPYCFIMQNNYDNTYYLLMFSTKLYYKDGAVYCENYETNDLLWYKVSINNSASATDCTYVQSTTNVYFVLDAKMFILWSNIDIPIGSVTSTDIYYEKDYHIQLRLTIKKLRGSTNVCQMSEINLYGENGNRVAWITGTSVSAPNASYSSSESPDKLIDDNTSTKFCCTNYTSFSNGLVILFQLQDKITFSKYSYVTGNDAEDRDPITWTLEYSNDGTEWAVASEVTNATITTSRNVETQKWDATILFVEKKYLIYDDSTQKYYNIVDNALNELTITSVTANDFLTYGNDEPPASAILITLQKPNILYWQDIGDLPVLSAQVTATPQPQTIISDKIYLTDESITGIESALATCEGDLIIAVSFDDKQTWKAWNGEQWATLSDDNTGMNKETLEAITFEQWNELYTGATGFYVRVSLLDSTQSVESIVFDFSN